MLKVPATALNYRCYSNCNTKDRVPVSKNLCNVKES